MAELLSAILREEPMVTSPTTGLRNTITSKGWSMRSNDYICFPWAIVEAKRDEETMSVATSCHCQAANDAASGISEAQTWPH